MRHNFLTFIVLSSSIATMSLSAHASECIIPVKKIGIGGLYLNQNVNEFASKTGLLIEKKLPEGNSKEGSIEFKDFDKRYIQNTPLGEISLTILGYDVANNTISSFSINTIDLDDDTKEKILKVIGIPVGYWKKNSDDNLEYSCSDYRLEIVGDEAHGYGLLGYTKAADNFYPTVLTKYHFTAKDLLNKKNQQALLSDDSEGVTIADIYDDDPMFRNKLDKIFLNKLGLSMDSFDMQTGLEPSHIVRGSYIVTTMWQKNEFHNNTQLTVYLAYDPTINELLVLSVDDNGQGKLYGDKTATLAEAMVKFEDFPLSYAEFFQ